MLATSIVADASTVSRFSGSIVDGAAELLKLPRGLRQHVADLEQDARVHLVDLVGRRGGVPAEDATMVMAAASSVRVKRDGVVELSVIEVLLVRTGSSAGARKGRMQAGRGLAWREARQAS